MLKSFLQFAQGRSDDPRRALSLRFIRGKGVEIGALHRPLWVATGAQVSYVDRLTDDELRSHYPELTHLPFVKVDVVDDGETLSRFESSSQDFIIANHFLEHTQDPIGTMRSFLDVLRPGGIVFMAVPDKRFTFDGHRPETDFAHVLRDYREGPQWSHNDHVREFASLVMGHSGEQLEAAVARLKATDRRIHFHVWSNTSLRAFFDGLVSEVGLSMKIVAFVDNTPTRGENIYVVRKTDSGSNTVLFSKFHDLWRRLVMATTRSGIVLVMCLMTCLTLSCHHLRLNTFSRLRNNLFVIFT
jgi:predicted SAM-dependent methyltransferase